MAAARETQLATLNTKVETLVAQCRQLSGPQAMLTDTGSAMAAELAALQHAALTSEHKEQLSRQRYAGIMGEVARDTT